MKKITLSIIGIIILCGALFLTYEYVTDKKIDDVFLTTTIAKDGKPADKKTTFGTHESIYAVAKQNRFWTKEAEIVLYKGDITGANRIDVQKNIKVNKKGYFTLKLAYLTPGKYGVAVYVDGNNIIETSTTFTVQ
jgi:hypothetical protein